MPTLIALQEEYPDAELYSLMVADKINLLSNLTEKRQFLNAFKVVLFSREDDKLELSIKDDEILSNYLDRIVILPQPDGTEGVSSSLVREKMLNGENCQDLLCPCVWDLFKGFVPADFPDMIDKFKGEYDFLSNRFFWRFEWQGLEYGSAEAAFQASKCQEESERLEIMESIIRAKFERNPILMRRLKDTGNRILINGNNKQETYWGVDLYSWQGENHLGKILMKIRDEN